MVSRTTEIKKLENLYSNNNKQVVLVYGGRGCLKEELLSSFCNNKNAFYYRSRNVSPESQLQTLSRDIKERFNTDNILDSYEDCFDNLFAKLASGGIVIIDDFEYIVKKDDTLIKTIDKYKKDMFIVLASSSLSWINNDLDDVLGNKNLIDTVIKLEEVGFLDVVRAFPRYSVEESVSVYGILGGVPLYLNRWSQAMPFKANVCDNILNPNGYLFDEVNAILGSELRELTVYNTILASIAKGNEKLNDLYNDTGYSRAKISVYIKNLAAFDIVSKVVSFETGGWDNAKKGVYRISNSFVNFYFHFIYPHLSQLYVMKPDKFYDTYIRDELASYLQRYFVNVCKEYLELLNKVGKCSVNIEKIGTWLGKTGTIDIVAQDDVRNSVVGKCNWEAKEFTYEDYEDLVQSMKQARINAKTVYLFSATSFDSRLIELSNEDSTIVLVDMKEL
ncbi:MAG: ATP-binding protein [Lachnospiraceae bacterium]|nr:ATP-binding protein [Lachnospiraceae bacterium]